MYLEPFHLAQPLWLPVAALAAGGIGAGLLLEARRRQRALDRLAERALRNQLVTTASPGRRLLKRLLLGSALLLTLLALARPQLGFHWEEVRREGIELMFAVDTSKSMLAQDLRPNRLTRAKLAVTDLVQKFQGDRVGLVAFAGDAFLQIPMTLDRDVFEQTLRTLKPGVVPVGGSDLASAIRVADQAFAASGNGQRLLILLSDGEDLEGAAITAAEQAAEHGVTIYTVGVGGTEGEILTVPDGRGGTQVVRDENGQPVTSKLDEATLVRIAEATGGAYVPLGTDGMGLERLYTSHLSDLERHTVESRSHRVYHDRFIWLLLPALFFALIEPFFGERGRARPLSKALPAAMALLALISSAQAAVPGAETYNQGVAAYESGDWNAALKQFEGTVEQAALPLHARTWYNLGNTRYRAGQATLEEAPSQTRALWEAALEAYDTAIELGPNDEDAVFNRDFVAKKLEELNEQEPPPPEDSECDNPSDEGGGSNESDEANEDGDQDQEDGSSDSSDGEDGEDGDQDAQEEQGDQDTDGNQGDQDTEADQGDQDSDADQGDQGDQDSDADQGDQKSQGGDQDSQGSQEEQAPQGQPEPQDATADPAGSDPNQADEAGAGEEDAREQAEPAGLAAATPGEDGAMSEEQAAALIRALGGDASTVPLFTPGVPQPQDRHPKNDW